MPSSRNLVILSLSLLGVAVVALLLAGFWQQAAVRDLALQAQLDRSLSTQRLVEQQQREILVQRTDLVASNQAFVSYVSLALDPSPLPGMGADVGSLTDILVERRDQSGLQHLAVLGLDGRVVAATDSSLLRRRDLSSEPLVQQALQSLEPSSGPLLDSGVLSFVAIKPLLSGSTAEGFLLAVLRLDTVYARSLSQASGLDVMLLARVGESLQPMASSLDPQRAALIANAINKSGRGMQIGDNSSGVGIPADIAPGGRAISAHSYPLFGDASQALQLAFLLPESSSGVEAAIWRPLLLPLTLIPLMVVGIALVFWRRLLRPISLLPELLRAAAAGDMHRAMPVEGGATARSIARGFNRLMGVLQQRLAPAGQPVEPRAGSAVEEKHT